MRLLPLLPLVVACTGRLPSDEGKETGDTEGETDGETEGETGSDTGGDTVPVTESLTATAVQSTQMDTVMRVSWTTSEPGNSIVEWGPTASYGRSTLDTQNATTDHEVLVFGLSSNMDIHWRARSVVNGEALVSEDATVSTGLPEQQLPDGTLSDAVAGEFTKGGRIIPLAFNPAPTVILDDQGQPSWWTWAERDLTVTDAQLARNGTDILYLAQDKNRRDDIGGLVRVGVETPEDPLFIALPYCHHGFAELEDGRLAFLSVEIRTVQGEDVFGDTIVLSDADGTNPETIWSVWDHWEADLDVIRELDTGFYPEGLDWTHGNSLQYNEEDSTLVASFHNISAVVKMSLTGETLWQMGGPTPTLTLDGDAETGFSYQHNPQQLPGGNVLMFDNGDYADTSSVSEAAEFALDESSGTYTRVWNWNWTGDEVAYLMGDVTRLDNGNTFTNWGASGALIEVNTSGETVWRYEASLGSILGFSAFHEHLGVPLR